MSLAVAPPGVAAAVVTGRRRVGGYAALTFRAPEIARGIRAGQFVNVGLEPGSEHLLRRPFSVARAHPEEGTLEIVFDVLGPGSAWIDGRQIGDPLDVVGPLGTPFEHPARPGSVLLAGGGYGTAALFQLAAELRVAGHKTHLVAGARSRARVLSDDALFDDRTITTDDGSAGSRGFVTEVMPGIIAALHPVAIYACGPMAMLAAVSRLAAEHGIECRVAAEEFMACGTGVCWTCVVPVRTMEGLRYARCCTEGPVFDGAAVEWR